MLQDNIPTDNPSSAMELIFQWLPAFNISNNNNVTFKSLFLQTFVLRVTLKSSRMGRNGEMNMFTYDKAIDFVAGDYKFQIKAYFVGSCIVMVVPRIFVSVFIFDPPKVSCPYVEADGNLELTQWRFQVTCESSKSTKLAMHSLAWAYNKALSTLNWRLNNFMS